MDEKENNNLKEEKEVLKKPESEKCPKCNGGLVKRNGKFGEFYGCSNYPKCHFTKK